MTPCIRIWQPPIPLNVASTSRDQLVVFGTVRRLSDGSTVVERYRYCRSPASALPQDQHDADGVAGHPERLVLKLDIQLVYLLRFLLCRHEPLFHVSPCHDVMTIAFT